MEYKTYGNAGIPCIAFAPERARFYAWEENGLVEAVAHWINEGKLMLICPDNIDSETFFACGNDRDRAMLHERWICYLLYELIPLFQHISALDPLFLLAGCCLGANHALNLYLRYPARFQGVIALSGLYDSRRFFDSTQDDLIYRNSPLLTLAALKEQDPRIPFLRTAKPLVLCCGKGPGTEQALADMRTLTNLLVKKEIPVWSDEWGLDVVHDWSWWAKQLDYFIKEAVFTQDS